MPRATIVLYHAGQSNGLAQSALIAPAPSGFAQVTFKRRDDTRYVIDAPGYCARRPAADLVKVRLEPSAPAGRVVAGFERSLEVRDRATKRAVSGASFQMEGRVSARATIRQGRAVERDVAVRCTSCARAISRSLGIRRR